MEQGDEILLQLAAHIDQQVAATDQVDLREGGVFDHILLGEDQHVADAFMDAIGAAVGIGFEEARQPYRRDIDSDAGRVETAAGCDNRLAVDIGGEYLHPGTLSQFIQMLLEQYGDRIGLLAGRASRRPDADRFPRRLAG